MDFFAPQRTDLANVHSLNRVFLGLLRDSVSGRPLRQWLPRDLRPVVAGMSDLQQQRLASAPFLLMSLREHDKAFWSGLDAELHNHDLFRAERSTDDQERLIMASLGFLWQLAQRNPFAVRLVTGAPIDWCDRIAESTLIQLVQAAARRPDLLELRFSAQRQVWDKLLGAGLGSNSSARAAAHMTALQVLLTADGARPCERIRAAACARSTPERRLDGQLRRR